MSIDVRQLVIRAAVGAGPGGSDAPARSATLAALREQLLDPTGQTLGELLHDELEALCRRLVRNALREALREALEEARSQARER